jgi:hypothetical protein
MAYNGRREWPGRSTGCWEKANELRNIQEEVSLGNGLRAARLTAIENEKQQGIESSRNGW